MTETPPAAQERQKKPRAQRPSLKRVYVSIVVAFGWLLFLALWLFYYATSFGIVQNIAVFLLSLVVAGMILTILWVPWAMRQTD
jgi:magnesium-transporting ATPase (P-type)